jgi:transketolase
MDNKSLRKEYGKTLVKLGKQDKNIVVLDADLAKSTKTIEFAKVYPERFFDFGLSEQDMIGAAAGLALTGKTAFVSSFAVFLTGRVYDQIRQSICYNNVNVKLVSTHSGLDVGEDGATHQMLEDISLMRTLPNMRVIVPADTIETKQVIEYVYKTYGPFYVRLIRNELPIVHSKDYKFKIGKASVLKEGTDITLIAIGPMVSKAVEAEKTLKKKGISATVINCSSIKPLDEETILKYVKKSKGVVTVEDHSIFGGLGSTIAEFLSKNHPIKMRMIGVDNKFGRSGKPNDLYSLYKLTKEEIINKVVEILGS